MTTNFQPVFELTPNVGVANISTGLSGLTVSGVTGLTAVGTAAPAAGRKIDQVTVKATATTTAGMVRLWLYSGSGNAQLIKEVPVTAFTVSATVAGFSSDWYPDNLKLPSGYLLYASTHNSEAFNVVALGGDYQ